MISVLVSRVRAGSRRFFAISALALVLFASPGCSSKTFVMHDEPRLVSEGEEHLVVETEPATVGMVRLKAYRQRDRTFEQHFWRAQQSAIESLRTALEDQPAEHEVASNLSRLAADVPPDSNGGSFWVFVAAVVVAFFVVAIPVFYFVVIAQGAATFLSVTVDSERTTVNHVETIRHPSAFVTLEPASGGDRIDLGLQPENGWVLTPEILRRLGGKGADVVVRDGELSTTVTLETR